MIPFKTFVEKRVSNPLRKNELAQAGIVDYNDPNFIENWKRIMRSVSIHDLDDPDTINIKSQYERLRKILPPRAEEFLDKEAIKVKDRSFRPKTKGFTKVYERGGIQVFVDDKNLDDVDFAPGTYNYRMVKNGVDTMLRYIRDILPNRSAKILITDISKNNHTANFYEPDHGAYSYNKLIFIDWRNIDRPEFFIHEYAHHVADLVPEQTQKLLLDAYKEMLDLYFRKVKRRRIAPEEIDDNMRRKISQKLGFPLYGLTNHDELFAVLIEKWKVFPNNPLTYKFKSLVKKVLTRL